ncbi:carboxymuconolactone decarboxylase family protein [bacterium]|nr:MAG: carboxymuconolactone decarboxylase family protein [bacterium]
MSLRIDFRTSDPAAYRALSATQEYIHNSGLPKPLIHLVFTRASQINGCAFCLDMHTREALADGESPQRLYTLSAWRETSFFTEQERAVLALTEHVTRVSEHGVPDAIYEDAARFFDKSQMLALLIAISTINTWNRMVISTGTQPVASKETRALRAAS